MCCIVNTVLAFPPPDNIWQTDILPFTSSQIFFWPITISTIPINIIHENFTMTLSCKLWFCLINVFFLSLHFRCLFVWLSLYCLRWQSQYLPLQTAEVEEGWRLEEEQEIWNVQCHLSVLCQSATTQYPAGQWASFLENSERINTLALDPWRFNFTFTFHTQPYFCQLSNCNSDDKIHVSNKWGLMEI